MSSSSLLEQKQKKRSESVRSFVYPRSRSALGEWIRMLAVLGMISALYIWRGGSTLLYLLIVVGMIMVGGLLLQLFGPRKIKLTRTITPTRKAAGEILLVKVEVSFSSWLPLPWMTIADYWGDRGHQELLFPGFRRSFSYTYTLVNIPRGIHHLHGCRLTWGDLPGWFTGRCTVKGEQSFKVLPVPLYFDRVPDSGLIYGESMYSKRGKRRGDEAFESRDYTSGDPLSRIHWKNSARLGTLQSKVPDREKGRMTCVILANSPESYVIPYSALAPRGSKEDTPPPVFEKAVSTVMGLLLFAEHSGTYVQLFSGGWPEGMARHEGLGRIPGRVLDILTEIAPDGTRSLSQLLEDASRSWIPGMTIAIITGQLEEDSAKVIARFLMQGVKVELYYAWDKSAPLPDGATQERSVKGTVGDSLARLGARIYCLEDALPAYRHREVERHESSEKPTLW